MGLTLREVRDEDVPLLFEQWADPVAVHMAAFTAPDHMDRDAFERRWSRLRADETVLTRVIVVDDEVAGTIGSWGDSGEREVTYWMGRSYWGKGSRPMPSMRSWPLIGRGRSTPTSRPTTSRPAASSRSAASA
jgi:RimJ/RimL family protein N-acetyltransferase